MLDRVVRAGLIVAHRILRVWWFVRRPSIRGAYVIVRRRTRTEAPATDAWEWLMVANSYKTGWTVPCGGIKPEERPRSAACRELREEVGLDFPEERLREVDEIGEVHLLYQWRSDTAHFFELTLHDDEAPDIRIDHREVIEARFVRLDRIHTFEIVPHVAEYLARSGSGASGC